MFPSEQLHFQILPTPLRLSPPQIQQGQPDHRAVGGDSSSQGKVRD